jgi:C-terminal processing protease CtpA/Prc
MHDKSLFQAMGSMILELKDGHTDIRSPFGRIVFDYTAGSKKNFAPHIINFYHIKNEGKERDGIIYYIIDSVGYMYVSSFSNEITENGIREVLNYFTDTKGIIIDIRNNTGGNYRYGKIIANHFFDYRRKVEIDHFKTGPGHDEFSTIDVYFEPENGLGISGPTVILTNRTCFSACNSFVSWMSSLPHVSIVGDTTGGGGGIPHFSELPNGWTYRYSANRSFRPDGWNMDDGIPPDHYVSLTRRDSTNWRDTLIEYALDLINP